jgi:hypothetical protein
MTQTPHVTVVINGHSEGLIAPPTFAAVERAATVARLEGIEVELLAVLDRPDELTDQVFASWASTSLSTRLLRVEYGDLGLSRNFGVARAAGDWIAFIDADDLWGSNWLVAAHRAAMAEPRLAVWHPETNLYFGARPHVFTHIDMDDPNYSDAVLIYANLWTALCFAPRNLLEQVPYPATAIDRQIGYEDWGWNMETVSRGAVHKVVPGTAHAIRTKTASLVSRTTAAACLPAPSSMLRKSLETRGRARSGGGKRPAA